MHLLAALLALLTPTHSQINGGLSFLFAGNRDILGLVERSGLRIRSVERKHMGTTMLIIAENPAS